MTVHFEASEEALTLLSELSSPSFDTRQHARLLQAAALETFDQCAKLQERFFQNLQVSLCQILRDDVASMKISMKSDNNSVQSSI